MNLSGLINIIKKNILFIIILAVLGSLVAFMSTSFIESGFSAQKTVFVRVKAITNQQNEGIDLQALTDTTVALISSPDFQGDAVGQNASITARKLAPQVITISVTSPNARVSNDALENAISKFNHKAESLITNAGVELVPTGESTQQARKVLNPKILAAFGALEIGRAHV